VIAELGLNHGGCVSRALAMVEAAAEAGASAVKLQTFTAARLVAPGCPAPAHVRAASLRELFQSLELDEEAHRAIFARARALGLAVMSTPFDERAVEILQRLGADAYKIASGDLTHDDLIECAARTGKPLVLSTGMADLAEVAHALESARRAGAAEVALLHCVSAYPVPAGSENLRCLVTLSREFGVPVGLSDHSPDPLCSVLAVALGADLYEKHLVLHRAGGDIDEAVSATPAELDAIVRSAARARAALGDGRKTCSSAEAVNRAASRRGLYAARALAPGARVAESDIVALRPAHGLDPRRRRELVGRRVVRRIDAGAPFADRDLDGAGWQEASADVA
jgi:sialic acid synthase SpsE